MKTFIFNRFRLLIVLTELIPVYPQSSGIRSNQKIFFAVRIRSLRTADYRIYFWRHYSVDQEMFNA